MLKRAMQKALFIKLRAMGDTVIMTASISAFKKATGDSVHVLVPEVWAPLLEGHPDIDQIWPWPKSKWKQALMVLALRREGFQKVFGLHAANTSALVAKLTGAPERAIHFHGKEENKYSTVEIVGKGIVKPIIERDLDTVRALVDIEKSETFLKTATEKKKGLLVLGLGASRAMKMWPSEKFRELAEAWNGEVIAIVGPGEEKLAEPLSGAAKVWSGSVPEMMELIASAELFVGNDSGPKHVAVALGVPTITLFGPENPFEWHPYDRKKHKAFFIDGLDCRTEGDEYKWCGVRTCEKYQHRCMRDIEVSQVVEAWRELI